MSLYSLSVLRVSIAERDSVGRIVASEEKPVKAENITEEIRETPKYNKKKNTVKMCIMQYANFSLIWR